MLDDTDVADYDEFAPGVVDYVAFVLDAVIGTVDYDESEPGVVDYVASVLDESSLGDVYSGSFDSSPVDVAGNVVFDSGDAFVDFDLSFAFANSGLFDSSPVDVAVDDAFGSVGVSGLVAADNIYDARLNELLHLARIKSLLQI